MISTPRCPRLEPREDGAYGDLQGLTLEHGIVGRERGDGEEDGGCRGLISLGEVDEGAEGDRDPGRRKIGTQKRNSRSEST
jgi:hypothetical protein